PGEEIKLIASGPALDLRGRNQQLFLAHVSRLAVLAPIEWLKSGASFLIRRWPPQRGSPSRNHAPVVVITRLGFPFIQLRPGDAFPGKEAYRLERRAPEAAAHVHQDAIHIEDEYFWREQSSFAVPGAGHVTSI